MFRSINPYTQEILGEWLVNTDDEVDKAIAQAEAAFQIWQQLPLEQRLRQIHVLAQEFKAQRETLATSMVSEMGKPIGQARAEVDKCAWACEVLAEQCLTWLADEMVATHAPKSYLTHRPLGVVLAVMPWNFPLWQVVRCAIPALAAGNAILFKPAPNVMSTALALQQVMHKAQFAPGVFQVLRSTHEQTERILSHPSVQGLAFTGSTQAGRKLAALAGSYLKKCVLELGGSDPYLILEDADLDLASEKCVQARLQNNGQSCIAAKRFIVAQSRCEEFLDKVVTRLKGIQMGDPLDVKTDLGPLARVDLMSHLDQQVRQSLALGAQCLFAGVRPAGKGNFFAPAILTHVRPGMAAFSEELFGPVFSIFEFADEKMAIRCANETTYGLGAAIFSRDQERAESIAAGFLRAGSVAINDFVRSDPMLPFGGIKESGFGRELGKIGTLEFTNTKAIVVGSKG